jgi:hypothetical protein
MAGSCAERREWFRPNRYYNHRPPQPANTEFFDFPADLSQTAQAAQ